MTSLRLGRWVYLTIGPLRLSEYMATDGLINYQLNPSQHTHNKCITVYCSIVNIETWHAAKLTIISQTWTMSNYVTSTRNEAMRIMLKLWPVIHKKGNRCYIYFLHLLCSLIETISHKTFLQIMAGFRSLRRAACSKT